MISVVLSLSLLLPTLSQAQLCYWPNGDLAPEYSACNPSASQSVCCSYSGGGSTCTTNGLCIDEYGTYRRGACTDQTFKDGACPKFCTNIVNGTANTDSTYDNLDYCGAGDGSQFVACCGDPGNYFNCDCNNKSAIFVTLDAIKPYTTVLPTASTSAGAASTSSSGTAATTTGASSSASAAPASSTSSASSSSRLSNGAVAGIVIAVAAVLLIIIGILVYLLLRARRKLANALSSKASYTGTSSGSAAPTSHSGNPTATASTLSGGTSTRKAPVNDNSTRRTSLEMSNASMVHEMHSPPKNVRHEMHSPPKGVSHEMLSPEMERPRGDMSWNEGEGGWMPSSDSGGGSGGGTSLGLSPRH